MIDLIKIIMFIRINHYLDLSLQNDMKIGTNSVEFNKFEILLAPQRNIFSLAKIMTRVLELELLYFNVVYWFPLTYFLFLVTS